MAEPVDTHAHPGPLSPVEKLKSRHGVKTFKCGKHSLDLFLNAMH